MITVFYFKFFLRFQIPQCFVEHVPETFKHTHTAHHQKKTSVYIKMFIRFMDQQRTKQKKHRPMPVGQEVFAVLEMYNEKKNLASLVLEYNELLLPYTHIYTYSDPSG